MAWTDSRIFRAWVAMPMLADPSFTAPTGYTNLEANTVKAALFNNSVTPDRDAAHASTGYNTGTWTTGNEVVDVTNWVAGGRALVNDSLSQPSSGINRYDADNLSGGGTVTISNAFGCLIYDDSITAGTVADQGVCFNYFGGAQSVTAGTFTIVWNENGIFEFTV